MMSRHFPHRRGAGYGPPLQSLLRHIFRAALFLAGPLALWETAALVFPPLVVAFPSETLAALVHLLDQPDFLYGQLLVSLGRIAMGLGLAIICGICLGVAAGLSRSVRLALEPFRWMFTSVPAVVVVMVAMLWFGMGTQMVVSIAATMLTPIIYVGVVEGMDAMDRELLEMAVVYRFSTAMRVRHIQLMAIAAPLVSSLVIATGNSVRIVILAEVLGACHGLGRGLAEARTNLDTPQLYAYVLLSLLIVGIVEVCIVRPLQRFASRWRT